ncbi:MAG: hypothetical protein GY862_23030, partial [Gammaproteobacteria bacterium]|nr:hypothetical protein [Gammaproteobacteria bacterium]
INDGRDDGTTGLRDQTTYYWRVTAIDSFGAKTESAVSSFYTDNRNDLPCPSKIYFDDRLNYDSVSEAVAHLNSPHEAPKFQMAYSDNGSIGFAEPCGTSISGMVLAPGYEDTPLMFVTEQRTYEIHVEISPVPLPGKLRFLIAGTSVNENEGKVTVQVQRMDGISGEQRINYTTVDGTANAGSDYKFATGRLDWKHGDGLNKIITISIIDDSIFEADETFLITLSEPQGGAMLGEPAQMEITIRNDDLHPVSVLNFSKLVYNTVENQQVATVYVTREDGLIGKVSARCVTENSADSAQAGSDYAPVEDILSWAEGEGGEKSCKVSIVNDDSAEKTEFVILKLELESQTENTELGESRQAVLIIEDDDLPPPAPQGGATAVESEPMVIPIDEKLLPISVLAFSKLVYEIAESQLVAIVTITRGNSTTGEVSAYCVTGENSDSAQAGIDYTPVKLLLHWPDGDDSKKSCEVPIINDDLVEKSEFVTLKLIELTGAVQLGVHGQAVLSITKDPGYDGDGDGIPDMQEEKAPNNGDGNGDGIADVQQANAASLPDAVSGYLTAVIDNPECGFTAVRATTARNGTSSDPGYVYPQGLLDLALACPANTVAGVSVHCHGLSPLREYAYRYVSAFSNNRDGLADIVDSYSVNGQNVLRYTLTDGQAGDDNSAPGKIFSLGGLAWHAGLPRFSSREYEFYQGAGEALITVERDGIGQMEVDLSVRDSKTGELYQKAVRLYWPKGDAASQTVSVQIPVNAMWTENKRLILGLNKLSNAAGLVPGSIDAALLVIRPTPVRYIKVDTGKSSILEIGSDTGGVTKKPDSSIVNWALDGAGNLVVTGVSPGHTRLELHNDNASTMLVVDITVFPKQSCPASSGSDQPISITASCDAFGLVYNDAELTEGMKVFNMEATGAVRNAGTVFNLTLHERGDFSGGTLSGSVINLGKVADVIFDQVIFVSGTLAGAVSGTGRVQDVQLAAGAHLHGVTVANSIRGDADIPALLKNVFVNAGTWLANVVLGKNVRFEDKMPAGENVRFTSVDVIPADIGLLKIFPELPGRPACMDAITGNSRRDLSAAPVQGEPAIMDAINAIPVLQENSLVLKQEGRFGYLRLDLEGIRFELQVVSIKRAAADAGVALLNQHEVRFITESGLEIVSQPALQAPCELRAITAELNFPKIAIQANGNLHIPVDAGTWLSARPDWLSNELNADAEPGLSAAESSYSAAASGKLAFVDTKGQLREQQVYPAPAHPDAFPLNESLEFGPYGWISFDLEGHRYQGTVDYWISSGKGNTVETLQVNSAGDVNDDGIVDFTLYYPGGDSQILFGVKK